MRKKHMIIVVAVILSVIIVVIKVMPVNKIKLKLDEQIGIAFLDRNIILIVGEKESTLLVLGEGKIDNLKKFKYKKLNILMLRDIPIDIKNTNKVILKGKTKIADVKYTLMNKVLYIDYEESNLCIYMGREYNLNACQIIYFYNNNVSNLNLHYENQLVLYHYKRPLPMKFLNKIRENFIDTRVVKDDSITIVKVGEDDYELVVIDNKK